jgi:hypothetical protein
MSFWQSVTESVDRLAENIRMTNAISRREAAGESREDARRAEGRWYNAAGQPVPWGEYAAEQYGWSDSSAASSADEHGAEQQWSAAQDAGDVDGRAR